MPCIKPLEAWQTSEGLKFAKDEKAHRFNHKPIKLACRNCIGCRIDKSREWAVRIMHEQSLHAENMFITLTYNDEHLPRDQGLHHDHFKDFMKRLRRWADYNLDGRKISYYMCGEYGAKFGRPHYHAIIFNLRMPDAKKYGKLWNSEILERLWGKGYTSIGNVTLQSAAYVARYIMKKVTGDQAEKHYIKALVDEETGEIVDRFEVEPEYNRMSTRPAIGKEWFKLYSKDFGENPEEQQIHINGKAFPMPSYYLRQLEAQDPKKYEQIMEARKKYASENEPTEKELENRKFYYEQKQFTRRLK